MDLTRYVDDLQHRLALAADAAGDDARALATPEPVEVDGATTRTTLRLPDHLKGQVETAAAREGVSVNTWLVRAVAGALEQGERPVPRPDAHGTSRLTGWVR
jgi:hypothetical protein